MTMDICRTFTGNAFVRYDGAKAAGNEDFGKWTVLAVATKRDDLPILESFNMGTVTGWINYEFTATSDWHPEKHKWDAFEIIEESLGIIDFALHLHFEGVALPFNFDETIVGNDIPTWHKLCEEVKAQTMLLLKGMQKGGELEEKYYAEVWKKLCPEILAKQ